MLMMYRMLVYPKASVSTPEDVCNRIKKNLTDIEKQTIYKLKITIVSKKH